MQRMWIDGRWTASVSKKTFPEPKHVHLDYRIEAKPYWYPYRWDDLKKDL